MGIIHNFIVGMCFIVLTFFILCLQVDTLLGTSEPQRLLRNEFMLNWDGVAAKDQVHVVVLGSTNKPYCLDEPVIRRFPCRYLLWVPPELGRVTFAP